MKHYLKWPLSLFKHEVWKSSICFDLCIGNKIKIFPTVEQPFNGSDYYTFFWNYIQTSLKQIILDIFFNLSSTKYCLYYILKDLRIRNVDRMSLLKVSKIWLENQKYRREVQGGRIVPYLMSKTYSSNLTSTRLLLTATLHDREQNDCAYIVSFRHFNSDIILSWMQFLGVVFLVITVNTQTQLK